MPSDRAGRVGLALLVVVLAVAQPAAGALPAGNGVDATGTVPLVTNTGMQVNVQGSPNITLRDPFYNSSAVLVATESGNATFVGGGTANVSVDRSNLTGTWTNVSALEVASTRVTIAPEDKPAAAVEGDVSKLNFTTPTVGDGNPDFVYEGASGTTTVEVHGVPASTALRAVDADTGTKLATGQSNSDGVVVFSGMPNSKHKVLIKESSGGPTLTNPQPEGTLTSTPSSLSVDVDDPDFDTGETVDLTFRLDGSVVGTESTTSAGAVSTSISTPGEGQHDASVAATDSDGNTQTLNWTFSLSGNLTVRNATGTNAVIDDRTIEATFYQNDTIINRTTSDGGFSLSGFAADERLVVDLNASGYNGASVVIDDLGSGKTAYLQNSSTTSTVDVRFTLTDRTGQFENNQAALRIQKPFDDGSAQTWRSIHEDEFGPAGVTHSLIVGQRYRLVVVNADGDRRVLGTYVAEISETVPLTVGQVQAVPEGGDTDWTHNASYLNASGQNYVQFEFNDTADMTDSVTVHIFEQGNETNELLVNTTFGGPLGTFAISEPVPAGENQTTWVVEAWVTRGAETQYVRLVVGPRAPVLPTMPGWLKAVISIGSIWVVAGLFSQVNGDVGAIVVSGMGGVFWFVDFLPQETGVGVVVLSLITAGIIFINERRSGL